MKLSLDEIKLITVGALDIREEADGIHFYKCTENQNKAWDKLSETLGFRARTTTGVRLDFHTNSKNLKICAKGGKFEIYVDNLLRLQNTVNELTDTTFELKDPLGFDKDEYRVTVYLPSHGIGVLSSIEIDDKATVTPHDYDIKMLFIGDSITQGWNTKYDSLSYAYRVTRFFNANSIIQGIGGAFYHETTFDSLPFEPDVVLVAYGTNDFGRFKTYDEFMGHVSAHLRLIASEYSDKQIFVLSPIWRKDLQERSMGTFDGARQIVIDEAAKLGLIHIDGLSLVPPIEEFFADGHLHPNSEGFSLYAENLIYELKKYITLPQKKQSIQEVATEILKKYRKAFEELAK
ncbi:MAG: SGNH/GDSL hydrolase family protein [Clostridia bacterium]|nr:SGNH/GDSL hydrolase family protein [Clostridia bacterium]